MKRPETGRSRAIEKNIAVETYLFPCSVAQRSCWFLDQISPGTAANNIAVRFRLEGPLQPNLLEEALREVVRRHEILRTNFVAEDGEPRQLTKAEAKFELPVIDLRAHSEAVRAKEAERISAEEARIGFNLQNEALFRGKLLRLGDKEFMLLLTMHHIVSDGWSVGIVTDEMGLIYEALVENRPHSLEPLPLQYADYACWQSEWLNGPDLKRSLAYWRNLLDGYQPLAIPTDFPRPPRQDNQGEIRSLVLPRSLTNGLKEISDRQGCTLFMAMLSVFLLLMRRESGQDEIVLRTQSAGRNQIELESLIGWFVNSVALKSDLSGDCAFIDLLDRTRDTVLGAFEHQNVPFERLMEDVKPRHESLRHPPFQVNFIFQRDFVKPWRRGAVEMTPIPSKSAGTFVDLNFFLVERKDGWRASIDVNTDVFAPETGDRLLAGFQSLLQQVVANPQLPVSHLAPAAVDRKTRSHAFNREAVASNYVPPATATEFELAAIWRQVLNMPEVSVESNFFDLGGHSLTAVQMLSKVQQELARRIDLADLFREPTIAAMAALIDYGRPTVKRQNEIVQVQSQGFRPPFFLVGGDHRFRQLANHLGEQQPFIGLSLERFETADDVIPFERIAESLVDTMQAHQPAGPYYLGGFCLDGALAYAVAHRLEALGKQVGLLVLFDAANPEYRREFNSLKRVASRGILRAACAVADYGKHHSFGKVGGDVADLSMRIKRRLTSGEQNQEINAAAAEPDTPLFKFRKLLAIAESRYTPPPVICPVLLIRSRFQRFEKREYGWGKLLPRNLQLVQIEAEHLDVLREPTVAEVAAALSHSLFLLQETRTARLDFAPVAE